MSAAVEAGAVYEGRPWPDGQPTVGRLTAVEILPDHPDYSVVIERVRRGPWLSNREDDTWLWSFGRTLAEWRRPGSETVVWMTNRGGVMPLDTWSGRDPDTTVIRIEARHIPRQLYEARSGRGEDPFVSDTLRVRRHERRPSQTPNIAWDAPESWCEVEVLCAEPDVRTQLEAALRRHDYKGSAEVADRGGRLVLRVRSKGGDPYRAIAIVDRDLGRLGIALTSATFRFADGPLPRPSPIFDPS